MILAAMQPSRRKGPYGWDAREISISLLLINTPRIGDGLPKCGAENPDYAVYCCTCSALVKEPKKPRYRGESRRKRSRIVIEDRGMRFKRLLKTAIALLLIAAGIVIVLWWCADYLLHNSPRYS